mmetsp:Transcript_18630/g.38712  ORF Transcript_18630/g.38712 Transcript_18630/m.38712 type:complete len:370 (+) Transcript_18630:830-1939(+)
MTLAMVFPETAIVRSAGIAQEDEVAANCAEDCSAQFVVWSLAFNAFSDECALAIVGIVVVINLFLSVVAYSCICIHIVVFLVNVNSVTFLVNTTSITIATIYNMTIKLRTFLAATIATNQILWIQGPPPIEHKHLPSIKSSTPIPFQIAMYPPLEMTHVLHPPRFEHGRSLDTANAPGAVHENLFVSKGGRKAGAERGVEVGESHCVGVESRCRFHGSGVWMSFSLCGFLSGSGVDLFVIDVTVFGTLGFCAVRVVRTVRGYNAGMRMHEVSDGMFEGIPDIDEDYLLLDHFQSLSCAHVDSIGVDVVVLGFLRRRAIFAFAFFHLALNCIIFHHFIFHRFSLLHCYVVFVVVIFFLFLDHPIIFQGLF